MGRIFLSYAREDRVIAERLARLIAEDGHDVWWDRHIEGGSQFSQRIEQELANADLVVVAWSERSTKSRWVRDEASVAGDDGRLIPITIDGTPAPMGFRQFHTLDLSALASDDGDGQAEELLNSLRVRLGQSPSPSERPAAAKPPDRTIAAGAFRSPSLILAVVALVFMVAGGLWWWKSSQPSASPTPVRFGLLPFTPASPGTEAEQLAIQAHDSIVHAFTDSGITLAQLQAGASRAEVDYVIAGNITVTAEKLIASVSLEDADQNQTVWTRQIEAKRSDAANLPDRIAAQLAGTLSWSGVYYDLVPDDPQLTTSFLQIHIGRDPLENYQIALRAATANSSSGWAQLSRSMYTAFALDAIPAAERANALREARKATLVAKEKLPNFGDAFIPDCILNPTALYRRCEESLERGLARDPDAPWVNYFYSRNLADVGRFADAAIRSDLTYTHDPYMPAKVELEIRTLSSRGAEHRAKELYAKAINWWPGFDFLWQRISGLMERGDYATLSTLADNLSEDEDASLARPVAEIAALVTSRSLPKLRQYCKASQQRAVDLICMIALAELGDLDAAYAHVDSFFPQMVGRTDAETEKLWLTNLGVGRSWWLLGPSAAPLRRDPRFLKVAERIGLLDYWRKVQLPDFCTKQNEPVCAQIRNG